MTKHYKLGKRKKDVLDKLDVETMSNLLEKEHYKLFSNIYDTLHYAIFKVGERMSPEQHKILLLPFELWGDNAGYIISEMRKNDE